MAPRALDIEPGRLTQWCTAHLGSPPVAEIFRSGYLSAVVGLQLADGREVVVKIRPDSARIAACVDVQRRLAEAGYPCPRPLTAALPFGDQVATAEVYVAGGSALPVGGDPSVASAEAYAWLIRSAPMPFEALGPAPSWAAWDHDGDELWPRPDEDPDVDLNAVGGAEWIDEVALRARNRLRAGRAADSEVVIGHCDWLAGNVRWDGDALLVVHDWDSVIAEQEAVLVGFAAALWSPVSEDAAATVDETEQFLVAYGRARGRELTADELERAWAAGAWTRAYDAKCRLALGTPTTPSLTEAEGWERLRRGDAWGW